MKSRLGRRTWWVVAVAALAGLLLSLVVVLPGLSGGGSTPLAVDEVRGGAALEADAGPAVDAAPAAPAPGPARPASRSGGKKAKAAPVVGRNDASLDALKVPRTRPPARVRVPSVGLDSRVRPVGVGKGRQMSLPADPSVLGWYRYGSGPGERGSVVMAGHVDSERFGIGPLARLAEIRAGDLIQVTLANGRTRTYRVDSIQRFDRQALPAGVFSRTGPERLRLVTCTGAFLPEAGGYQQNLVVTAVPA
ncbi:class F sortase [Nocardioides sp. GCM10027113]|uniref:class F sortase n=1 Tax=unclassified Nocardioides TaxID=2615069 RepID=UPI00361ECE34